MNSPLRGDRDAGVAPAEKRGWIVALPIWAIVLLCSGLPLAWLLLTIVTNPHVLRDAWPDAFRAKLLGRTLLYNGLTALIAGAMGIPVGLVLGRGRGWVAKILWVALPVSLLLPSLAYAYGWAQFFRLLRVSSAAMHWTAAEHFFTFDPAGKLDVMRCVWSLATWLWPIPAATVGIALRRLDTNLQSQALLDGGLWRITLRSLAAPIAASIAICAVLAVQEFAVYEPTGISVIATETRMVFETGNFSSPDNPITAPMGPGSTNGLVGRTDQPQRAAGAVAVTLPLLIVILLLATPVFLSARNVSATEDLDVGPWPRALDAGWVLKCVALAVIVAAVIVPTLALFLSLKVWRSPLEVWDEFNPQVVGSLLIAGIVGVVALFLGSWSAAARVSVLLGLGLVTFLIGGQLIAIAMVRIYNRPGLGWIYNMPPVVVMAHVARFGWVALVAGRATWSPRWQGLRDLAAVDGAGPVRTAAKVIWPLAWPLLLAAGVLVMALSLTEVPATLFLSPQRPPMLTPMLMTWVHMLRYDSMIEVSLLLMSLAGGCGLAVAGLIWLSRKWVGFNFGMRVPLPPKQGFEIVRSVVILALLLTLVGCRDSKQPEAIWCDTGTGPAQVVYPRGIVYKPQDDTFFVVDRMARIQHFDHAGKFLGEWRMPDWKTGKPVGLSIGPDGNVYVPDTHYQRVMVYTPDGQLLRKWGSMGTEPGQFIYPTDIAFDKKGNVFVGEYGDNDRIQVFTPDGQFLYTFGHFGKGPGHFMRPQSLVIDGDTLYVADACNHRIDVWKTDGTFVRSMGSIGSGLGSFRFPYGLDMDKEGHLIVCEFGNNRVQMIDKDTGRGLKIWGDAGHEPGQLAYPWAVAVDKRDRVVAVDAGNNRLQVFEF